MSDTTLKRAIARLTDTELRTEHKAVAGNFESCFDSGALRFQWAIEDEARKRHLKPALDLKGYKS